MTIRYIPIGILHKSGKSGACVVEEDVDMCCISKCVACVLHVCCMCVRSCVYVHVA